MDNTRCVCVFGVCVYLVCVCVCASVRPGVMFRVFDNSYFWRGDTTTECVTNEHRLHTTYACTGAHRLAYTDQSRYEGERSSIKVRRTTSSDGRGGNTEWMVSVAAVVRSS